MVGRLLLGLVAGVGFISGVISCATLGTKVDVLSPETFTSMKTIAIWPVCTVPMVDNFDEKFPELVDTMLQSNLKFRSQAEDLSRLAELTLYEKLISCGLFRVIPADSVALRIRQHDSTYARFPRADWFFHRDLINCDGILVTKLTYKRQSGGVNTYATLCLYESISGKEAIAVKFNTQWGKSYLFAESGWTTMPDAIKGAVNGLAKSLRKYRSSDD